MKSITLFVAGLALALITTGCSQQQDSTPPATKDDLEAIAYDAFVYAYPLMEQVRTVNGMMAFMNMRPNKVVMNTKLPRENVGMPIVAPNLTSMTDVVFLLALIGSFFP